MIVWINGAFGSGKTTLVGELAHRRPDAVVLDPELIGYQLRQIVAVPTGDFQDLPSWREIVVASVVSVHRHHADLLIVPMTLVDETYRREVLDPIRDSGADVLEVFIDLPADELRRRIEQRVMFDDDPERDAAAREFCVGRIDDCIAAARRLGPGALVLDAAGSSPAQLADTVLERIPGTADPPRI